MNFFAKKFAGTARRASTVPQYYIGMRVFTNIPKGIMLNTPSLRTFQRK